jgi:uncharacterized protein (DUF608 family)
MLNKKKLDKWIQKTICTHCKFLRPEAWTEEDGMYLVYTCKIDKTDILNKARGKTCNFFIESSPTRLKINKSIYNKYVNMNFDEEGKVIDTSLWEHYDGNEIIGHR